MMNSMGFLNKLKNLDAYPKINEDFYKRTLSGGIITAVSGLVILLLFISETRLYLRPAMESNLVVDTSRGERLQVYFDITFPEVPCTLLSVDTQDISGEQHYDIRHDITKKRLHVHGHVIESTRDGIGAPKIDRPLQKHGGRLEHDEKYCGTCYGAEATEDQCCNTCEEVQEAYRKKGWALPNLDLIDQCAREGFVERVKAQQGEGCNVDGFLDVSKVAGNVHFAPGKGYHHSNVQLQELADIKLDNFNITHKINKLSFGTKIPGVVNPLDGSTWTQTGPSGSYQYFIKVVPTIYTDVAGHEIKSNQFSVTEHYKDASARQKPQPSVVIYYDFSPIKVIFKEEKRSFLHYLTNLCAIVGGVFTVSGIIDSFIYHGQKAIKKKKIELGKFT